MRQQLLQHIPPRDGRRSAWQHADRGTTAAGWSTTSPCSGSNRAWPSACGGVPLREPAAHAIEHAELWGQRAEKFRALDGAQPLTTTPLEPHTPYYFLVPRDRRGESEYARGYLLSEIMPVNSTAAVTARDSFVVAFSAAELRERMAVLCDADVPDDEIRRRYLHIEPFDPVPTRRHARLATRRRRASGSAANRIGARHIRDCLYRPFDRRKIFWTPWMIDWPRKRS